MDAHMTSRLGVPGEGSPPSPLRDAYGLAMLLAATILAVPAWNRLGAEYQSVVAGQLGSCFLPMALGLMLVVRRGGLDLSLWALSATAGVATAEFFRAGFSVGATISLVLLLGLGLGGVNGVLVRYFRLPSPLATGLVGVGLVLGLDHHYAARSVAVPDDVLQGWTNFMLALLTRQADAGTALAAPLLTFRMLLVFATWGAVMVGLMVGRRIHPNSARAWHARTPLALTLVLSGGLSAIGGLCWVLDLGAAPVPSRLVDGLRIPAAVLLCGAIVFQGRGRVLLAGILLPVALLVVTLWEQLAWPASWGGYSVPLLWLLLLFGLAQGETLWALQRRKTAQATRTAWLGMSAGTLAAMLLVITIRLEPPSAEVVRWLAAGSAGVGAVLLAVDVHRSRRAG
jgi:ribose/xylose/arabinose/galactoside ABC-type transport system permease subunit